MLWQILSCSAHFRIAISSETTTSDEETTSLGTCSVTFLGSKINHDVFNRYSNGFFNMESTLHIEEHCSMSTLRPIFRSEVMPLSEVVVTGLNAIICESDRVIRVPIANKKPPKS